MTKVTQKRRYNASMLMYRFFLLYPFYCTDFLFNEFVNPFRRIFYRTNLLTPFRLFYRTHITVPILSYPFYCTYFIVPILLYPFYCTYFIVPILLYPFYCTHFTVPILLYRFFLFNEFVNPFKRIFYGTNLLTPLGEFFI